MKSSLLFARRTGLVWGEAVLQCITLKWQYFVSGLWSSLCEIILALICPGAWKFVGVPGGLRPCLPVLPGRSSQRIQGRP